jgi:hypothetical protein
MEDSRQEGAEDAHSSGEDDQESEDEAMGEAPPVEEDAGCSQEGSEDEDEGGEEEDMMDEEQSETVANTEDYDAKHVRFRYHEYLLQIFLKKYFFFAYCIFLHSGNYVVFQIRQYFLRIRIRGSEI